MKIIYYLNVICPRYWYEVLYFDVISFNRNKISHISTALGIEYACVHKLEMNKKIQQLRIQLDKKINSS